jgi:uncharacterized protein (DUF362 family)
VLKGASVSAALLGLPGGAARLSALEIATRYDFKPRLRNTPVGEARGIHPGRVVWVHDPRAAHWSGHVASTSEHWWADASTDQKHVDAMLSKTLRSLTGAESDEAAWAMIIAYYNKRAHRAGESYSPGEVVAVKVNLNNSSADGPGNIVNVSPQLALAVVRQLVDHARVRSADIVIYDARRNIYPALLTKVWSEFPEVRFVQWDAPAAPQPKNPGSGDYRGLEQAQWVKGVSYSLHQNEYYDAKLIPKQIKDATYLVNVALLKAHSYPYASAEGGDEGQTGVTMTGKNHFGSIKGTPELHGAINTNRQGTPHAYSPIVDLAASPNLGAKTILYVLDGLYCARRHQSYPLHFPNPPFNNRVVPYENPEWPSSLLASMDGVALDSVGLDILYSQTKNNEDEQGHPRIMIRENADDYLQEMALPDRSPSGTAYIQDGKPVSSLGVFEHWDGDETRKYSRNKDPQGGQGIELIYLLAKG